MSDRHMLLLAINGHHLVLALSAIACGVAGRVFTSERSRGSLMLLGTIIALLALSGFATSSDEPTAVFPFAFLLEVNFIVAFAKTRELFAGVMAALSVVGIGLVVALAWQMGLFG